MRVLKYALILLGVLSLVVLVMPWLGMIAAVTVIGIPIAIAYWAIPAFFFVALIVYCLARLLPLPEPAALISAGVLCGLILTIPPFILNKRIHADALSYTEGDVDRLEIPSTVDAIAVVQRTFSRNRNNSRTTCDGFCLHALLSGTAKEVLIADKVDREIAFSTSQSATAYRLGQRFQCPDINFGPGTHELKLPVDGQQKARRVSAAEIMKLEISRGNCLLSREATLAEADWILQRGQIRYPDLNLRKDGFSFTQSTVKADRLAVYKKTADGNFDETYRWTGIRYRPFLPVLLPGPEFFSGFETAFGWIRKHASLNIDDKYYQGPDWEGFLTQTLGFDLALDGDRATEELPKTVADILTEQRPPTRQEWAFIEGYFDRLGIAANNRMGADEFDLAMQLLANPDFPAVPRLYNINRYLEKHGSDAKQMAFAELLMKRLESGATWPEGLDHSVEDDLDTLSHGFSRLPDVALRPLKERHLAIARERMVQIEARSVITKLHVHGEGAVPALLAAMETGLGGGENFFRGNEYQHPYLGGLMGLCNGGERLASALPKLLEWSKAGRLPDHASYGNLLTTTVLRLGGDEETAWSIYKTDDKNRTRERFDRLVRKSSDKRYRCSY